MLIKKRQTNQLRIIAGQWRGRKLHFPDLRGLRPTSDRIRETLFNWLQSDITGANCLDLFAGSGALGLEALSRNADSVVFVDSSKSVIDSIKRNLEMLNANQDQLFCENALTFLKTHQQYKFDIVFLDPPFGLELLNSAVLSLQNSHCLKKGALIYLESEKTTDITLPESWVILKEKKTGNVRYCLCEAIE